MKGYVTMISNLKKFFIIIFILIFLFQSTVFGTYIGDDTIYVWSESTTPTSTATEQNSDFLDLACESAILIEQTTRNGFIRKKLSQQTSPSFCY